MAGRIHDKLVGRYGADAVFMDIDSMPLGIDFREHLDSVLADIDVLVAVVGPRWVGRKADGSPRIKDRNDYVRLELEAALARKIPVIPVLVDGAEMPKEEEVPDSLAPFLFRHAAEVDTGIDFHTHMDRLMKSVDRILLPPAAPAEPAARPGPPSSPQPAVKAEAPKASPPPPKAAAQPTAKPASPPASATATRAGGLNGAVWLVVAVGGLGLAAVSPLLLFLGITARLVSAVIPLAIAIGVGYALGSRRLAFSALCVAAIGTGVVDAVLTYVIFAVVYGASTVLPAPILLFILADAVAIVSGDRLRRVREGGPRILAGGIACAVAAALLFAVAYAAIR